MGHIRYVEIFCFSLFFILTLAFSPSALAIRSCIIDGGGALTPFSTSENSRLCGSEITFPLIRDIYNSSVTTERLLTGDGNAAGNDCVFGRFYQRNASGRDELVSRRSTVFEDLQKVQFSARAVAPLNTRSTVLPATHNNVTNSCLSGTTEGEVCHIWSVNHGQNRNRGQGSMIKLMDTNSEDADFHARELSNTIGNSKCGTTRFVLNNCNSGGMLSAIFDENNRVIPNRCGSASTTEFEKSRGLGTEPTGMTPMRMGAHEKIIPSFPTYHHIHHMTGALKAAGDGTNPDLQRTMDTAHFWSLVNNPVSEQPLLSTDFYLNKFAESDGRDIYDADPLDRANALEGSISAFEKTCGSNLDRYLVTIRTLTTQMAQVLRHFNSDAIIMASGPELTDAEIVDARNQMDNARWKIKTFELSGLCVPDYWDGGPVIDYPATERKGNLYVLNIVNLEKKEKIGSEK